MGSWGSGFFSCSFTWGFNCSGVGVDVGGDVGAGAGAGADTGASAGLALGLTLPVSSSKGAERSVEKGVFSSRKGPLESRWFEKRLRRAFAADARDGAI